MSIIPSAARTEIAGRHGDAWKVRVAAPPERGRANAALLALLIDSLGVPPDAVRIVSGQTARRKIVEIDGLREDEAERRLGAAARG